MIDQNNSNESIEDSDRKDGDKFTIVWHIYSNKCSRCCYKNGIT